MDTTGSGAPSMRRRIFGRLLALVRLHRHRVEPDLSALVAFPSCRCGELLWPEGGGLPTAAPHVGSGPPLA